MTAIAQNARAGFSVLWHSRWGKQPLLLLLYGTAAFLLIHGYLAWSPYQFMVNDTSSEPRGLYLVHKFSGTPKPRLGELVVFAYNCPLEHGECVLNNVAPYPDGSHVLKRIGALPGDILNVVGKNVYRSTPAAPDAWILLGHRYRYVPGVVPPRAIPTYAEKDWHLYRIPAGEFYGWSQRTDLSYDSRYYGLDRYSQLVGSARLLWRFNPDGFIVSIMKLAREI